MFLMYFILHEILQWRLKSILGCAVCTVWIQRELYWEMRHAASICVTLFIFSSTCKPTRKSKIFTGFRVKIDRLNGLNLRPWGLEGPCTRAVAMMLRVQCSPWVAMGFLKRYERVAPLNASSSQKKSGKLCVPESTEIMRQCNQTWNHENCCQSRIWKDYIGESFSHRKKGED